MIDTLEARRLFAAATPTAVLNDGVLTVTGNDSSNTINVTVGLRAGAGVPATGNDGSITLKPTTDGVYLVTVDGNKLGSFEIADVKSIKIYGLGGRDRINGPTSFVDVINAGIDGKPVQKYILTPVAVAPTYIDGGSGSDKLFGGTGDDTLIGGRGNDYLVDEYGSNTLNGGQGDDTFNTADGKAHGIKNIGSTPTVIYETVTGGTPDTIIDDATVAGAVSTIRLNADDILQGFGKLQLANSKNPVLDLKITTQANGGLTFDSSPVTT